MEVYDAIQKRRSVRQYKPDRNPEDILNKLLSAKKRPRILPRELWEQELRAGIRAGTKV